MFPESFKKYKKAFVFGTGGGNDIVSAIIPALHLNKLGVKTDIGGVLSPAAFHIFNGSNEQIINKVHNVQRYIKTPLGDVLIAFVDNYLPHALRTLGHEMKFYNISFKFGTDRLIEEFNQFILKNDYDLVVAVDVGGDILGTVEDTHLLSPMMDFTSLFLLRHLEVDNYLIEFGLGTDGELRPDGMKRILEELKDDYICSEIGYDDAEVKFFREVFDNIKHIRQGHTNVMTLQTLQSNEDIVSEYRYRSQIGKKKWFTKFQITLPKEYHGKVWLFNGRELSLKRKETAFAYENPFEQFVKLKKMCPYWKTEMDLFYWEDNFLLTPSLHMSEEQRNEIIKEGEDIPGALKL